jgi:hypothetical protein
LASIISHAFFGTARERKIEKFSYLKIDDIEELNSQSFLLYFIHTGVGKMRISNRLQRDK